MKKNETITKRIIASKAAQIFDSMGLIAPVTIRAKLIIQRLWQNKKKWDEAVDDNEKEQWVKYYNELNGLNVLKIPRWIGTVANNVRQIC